MSNASPNSEVGRNEVIVYQRDPMAGTLDFAARYPTGGFGNIAAGGPELGAPEAPPDDPLGSQNALRVSDGGNCIFAVNAGSDSISTFKIDQTDVTKIELTDIDSSFGQFPVSIAQFEDLVYVLNAGNDGGIHGYNLDEEACVLTPILNSGRSLLHGLNNPPFFVFSPAQISFDPSGEYLVVTNKGVAGEGTIVVYELNTDGSTMTPVATPSTGFTPFGFTFDSNGNILVVEAFGAAGAFEPAPQLVSGAVSSYSFPDLIPISASVPTNQTTSCWIQYSNGYAITTNNGGNSTTILEVDVNGALSVVAEVAAGPSEGLFQPIDHEFSPDGEFLYVISTNHLFPQTGQPEVVVFQNAGTSISVVESVSNGLPNEDMTLFGVVGMAIL